jgi:hypothetical protein
LHPVSLEKCPIFLLKGVSSVMFLLAVDVFPKDFKIGGTDGKRTISCLPGKVR